MKMFKFLLKMNFSDFCLSEKHSGESTLFKEWCARSYRILNESLMYRPRNYRRTFGPRSGNSLAQLPYSRTSLERWSDHRDRKTASNQSSFYKLSKFPESCWISFFFPPPVLAYWRRTIRVADGFVQILQPSGKPSTWFPLEELVQLKFTF